MGGSLGPAAAALRALLLDEGGVRDSDKGLNELDTAAVCK